jgi:hypothetical protein
LFFSRKSFTEYATSPAKWRTEKRPSAVRRRGAAPKWLDLPRCARSIFSSYCASDASSRPRKVISSSIGRRPSGFFSMRSTQAWLLMKVTAETSTPSARYASCSMMKMWWLKSDWSFSFA